MEKINFVNYSQPAINATNLNKLQQNVEDAIQEVQDVADDLDTNKLDKTSVKDTYSTSATDTYSCNYVNGIETYSTDETRVGTWIDKPLYRKVISGSISSSTGNIQVPDLETLVKYYGNCTIAGGNDKRPFPFYELNTSGHLFDFSTFGNGYISYNSTWNVATYQITIEYTKTND